MKLLVLATEKVTAEAVRSALPGEELDGAEVLVVAPAVNQSAVAFWMSDSDEAIDEAQARGDAAADALGDDAASATAVTGESEPLLAVQDALATFQADRIVVLGDADLAAAAQERFDVPVVSG